MNGMSENVRKCPNLGDNLNEPGVGLNERQHAAIEMLLCGKSVGAVAAAVGIDPRTLYRWRQDEAFRLELEARRREMWSEASERLCGMVHPSLDILERQLADRYDRARFAAATAILRLAELRKPAPVSERE